MPRKPRQQTMEASLGTQRIRQVVRQPVRGASSGSPAGKNNSPAKMRQQRLQLTSSPGVFSNAPSSSYALPGSNRPQPFVLNDDSSSSADEIAGLPDDEEGTRAPAQVTPRSSKMFPPSSLARVSHQQHVHCLNVEDEDDEDDVPLGPRRPSRFTASSTNVRRTIDSDDEDDDLPIARKGRSSQVPAISDEEKDEDEDEDEDDLPRVPRSSRKGSMRSSQSRAASETSGGENSADDDEDEDEDNLPLTTPASTRRKDFKRARVMDDSDDDLEIISSPTKRRRLVAGAGKKSSPPPSSARAAGRKTPRTSKERARELLRRKRAGETIDEEDLEPSDVEEEEEEKRKAIYDTDSDSGLVALAQFDDDEEGVPEYREPKTKEKNKTKASRRNSEDGEDDELDDFVVDDPEGLLGVPDSVLAEIPLEFTSHRHKPLKEHFKHAIEWLVQSLINPSFERTHELYRFAWQRLDDEVSGLARSKFASSAWNKEFTMALRARPEMQSEEIVGGDLHEFENCGACGRSGHPAKWIVRFQGTPYHKNFGENFLQPIEADSDDEDDGNVDENGNTIAAENRAWYCGSVCNSNADMASQLLHWKYELLGWAESTLKAEKHLTPEGLARLQRMKPKKKYKLVDEIIERWTDSGVMRTLWSEFKGVIERARTQSTAGKRARKGVLR